MIAQTTRAILFAMATLATRAGLRASNAIRCGSVVSGLCLARRINEVAPITRSFLRYRSPILVMRPSRSLPPLEFCDGVSPSQAANSLPERNCPGSATDAASAVAPTGPMPGMVDRRRATSSGLCRARIERSIACKRTWVSRTCPQSRPRICIASAARLALLPWPRSGVPVQAPAPNLRGMSMPNSANRPRIMLTSCVRCLTRRLRER